MSENQNHTSPFAEPFGNVPNDSAAFGKMPNASEPFRTMRNDAEGFRNVPKASERKENHSLTVRDVVRLFEAAGVARTERSVTNWCQPNRTGIARLDSYFDPNERKYYITPQSVELAIAEEQAKAAKLNQPAETFGSLPKEEESFRSVPKDVEMPKADESRVKELERENLDLKIANRGKDFLIEQMQKERDNFFQQTINASRKVGELEAKLLQLESSK